jgi:hypothetical protein
MDYVVRSRGQISTLVTFSLAKESAGEDEDEEDEAAGDGSDQEPEEKTMQFMLWGVDNCAGAFVNHHPDKTRRNVRLIRTHDDIQTVQQLSRLDCDYFWFQACQDIAAGSELFCDYGATFFAADEKVLE